MLEPAQRLTTFADLSLRTHRTTTKNRNYKRHGFHFKTGNISVTTNCWLIIMLSKTNVGALLGWDNDTQTSLTRSAIKQAKLHSLKCFRHQLKHSVSSLWFFYCHFYQDICYISLPNHHLNHIPIHKPCNKHALQFPSFPPPNLHSFFSPAGIDLQSWIPTSIITQV